MSRQLPSRLNKGDTIDYLTLLECVNHVKVGHSYDYEWKCHCICGNEVVLRERSLRKRDHFHSCGCYFHKNLRPADTDVLVKAGKARAESRNVDGCNVDMLFRDKVISTNTSGVQGVSWSKNMSKWHVYVGYKSRRATLGYYESLEEAKRVRECAIEAIKQNNFEDYFFKIRGKEYGSYQRITNDK